MVNKEEIIEKLAEQVHIEWMEGRIKQGWVYGPERNDEKKTNPCLVPYADLPESEKDYDRNTAKKTIETLEALGYEIIEKKENE